MDNERRHLREAFEYGTRPLTGPPGLNERTVRRAKRRRLVVGSTVMLSMTMVVAGALGGAALLFGGREGSKASRPPVAAGAATSSSECSTKDSAELDWTSPMVKLAGGTVDDDAWLLCIRTAVRVEDQEGSQREAFCFDWSVGAKGTDIDCLFPDKVVGDPRYFQTLRDCSDPAVSKKGYVGVVSGQTAEVSIKTESETVKAALYDAPPELAQDVKFFVGYGVTDGTATLEARDGTGNALLQHEYRSCAPFHPSGADD